MWIVQLALKRPYTFAVMAMLIVVLGATSITQMRSDIFLCGTGNIFPPEVIASPDMLKAVR